MKTKRFNQTGPQKNMKIVRKIFLPICLITVMLLSFHGSTMAQDTLNVAGIQKDSSNTVWHSFKTVGEVEIYYQYVDCDLVEFIQFKAVNTSSSARTVSWNFKKLLNGIVVNGAPDDELININLQPGGVSFGACYSENLKFGIFVREAGRPLSVTDIVLQNILIN